MIPLVTFLRGLAEEDLRNSRFELAFIIRIFLRQLQTDYLLLPSHERDPVSHRIRLCLLTAIIQALEQEY